MPEDRLQRQSVGLGGRGCSFVTFSLLAFLSHTFFSFATTYPFHRSLITQSPNPWFDPNHFRPIVDLCLQPPTHNLEERPSPRRYFQQLVPVGSQESLVVGTTAIDHNGVYPSTVPTI